MNKQIINLARKVLSNPSCYPKITLCFAQQIDSYYNKVISAVSYLWEHHELSRTYLRLRNEARALGKSYPTACNVYAGNQLRKLVGAEQSNSFHKNRSERKFYRESIKALSREFKAQVMMCECQDFDMMLLYMECVNEIRYDDTLVPVKFMKQIDPSHVAEIFAFRLVKLRSV